MRCELCDINREEVIVHKASYRVILIDDADYPGFCRVIWNDHVKEMTDLMEAEQHLMMKAVFSVESAVREIMQPDKINLASLGNMTPHLHWHVIPRFTSDRHFPNPIWGQPQRAAALTPAAGWKMRLMQCIQKKLG